MLCGSFFFSLILLVVCERFFASRKPICALVVAGLYALSGWHDRSLLLIENGLALFAVTAVFYFVVKKDEDKARSCPYFLSGFIATVLCYVHISWAPIKEQRELLAKYPLQSLEDRLTYETAHERKSEEKYALNEEAQESMDRLSERGGYSYRRRMLYKLHEKQVELFIDSPGFGYLRRIRPDEQSIKLPAPTKIPLSSPNTEWISTEAWAPKEGNVDLVPIEKATRQELLNMHEMSFMQFANEDRSGYVRDLKHVVGFQEHHFRWMPGIDSRKEELWGVDSVELISLLKFPEPRVYVSKYLPNMKELRNGQTRPAMPFELEGVKELRRGKALYLRSDQQRIHLIGAVRALDRCVRCHQVEKDDLLGAFSYRLSKMKNPPKK